MDKRSWPWIGGAMIVVGVIWIGQGLGFVAGDLMQDSLFWASMGLLVLIAGISLLAGSLGKRPPKNDRPEGDGHSGR